jgi:hypothetical protein
MALKMSSWAMLRFESWKDITWEVRRAFGVVSIDAPSLHLMADFSKSVQRDFQVSFERWHCYL